MHDLIHDPCQITSFWQQRSRIKAADGQIDGRGETIKTYLYIKDSYLTTEP